MGRSGLRLCGVAAVALSLSCAVRDEARRAGVTLQQLIPKAVEPADDYFREMDYNRAYGTNAPALSRDEIAGRAMWMVWTGGNDRLWDRLPSDTRRVRPGDEQRLDRRLDDALGVHPLESYDA